jgi:hypothetical protein
VRRGTPRLAKGLGDPVPDEACCSNCGYSLKGLRSGGRCPECGTPISFRARRHRLEENLTDAPPRYLRDLAVGCWLLFGGAIAVTLMSAVGRTAPGDISAGIEAGTGLMWMAGVWIVTRPRQTATRTRGELSAEWRRTRWVVRFSQAGWALAGGAACAAFITERAAINAAITALTPYVVPSQVKGLRGLAGLGTFVGIVGLAPLCVMLADLADWAGNSTLAERFRTSAWAVTLGAVTVALAVPIALAKKTGMFGPVALTIYGLSLLGCVGFALGLLMLLLSLAQLAGMSLWAIHSAGTRAESARRIAERRERHIDELAERSARAGASPVAEAPRAPTPADSSIYALAPEEDPDGGSGRGV